MRIQNNIMAMNTHRFYTINNNAVSKSAEKLSSGYRVNRAGDDAAGLAISEKMRAEIRGLAMASKNAQDGVSMVQTAEGALTEVHSMLQRMKELAVQAASDSNADEVDRPALEQEFAQLLEEIDDVAESTTFNDMKLLDGTFQDKVIQIGSRTGNEMDISIGKMSAFALGLRDAEAIKTDAPEGNEGADSKGKLELSVTEAGAGGTGSKAKLVQNVSGVKIDAANQVTVSDGSRGAVTGVTEGDGNGQRAIFTVNLTSSTAASLDKNGAVVLQIGGKEIIGTASGTTAADIGAAFDSKTITLNLNGSDVTFDISNSSGVLTFTAQDDTATGTDVSGLSATIAAADNYFVDGETVTMTSTGDTTDLGVTATYAANSDTWTVTGAPSGYNVSFDGEKFTIEATANGAVDTSHPFGTISIGDTSAAGTVAANGAGTWTDGAAGGSGAATWTQGDTITFTDDKSHTLTATYNAQGKWDVTGAPAGYTATYADGKLTITADTATDTENPFGTWTVADSNATNSVAIANTAGTWTAGEAESETEPEAAAPSLTSAPADVTGTDGDGAGNNATFTVDFTGASLSGAGAVKMTVGGVEVTSAEIAEADKADPAKIAAAFNGKTFELEDDDGIKHTFTATVAGNVVTFTSDQDKDTSDAFDSGTLDAKLGAPTFAGVAPTGTGTGDANTTVDPEKNGGINLLTQENASETIDVCKRAIDQVSTERAKLGAIQNRLEHKITNLDNTVENVSAAEARIRDVDIAKEMTNFTKNQILSQAATAMLAQANALPQGVLSLLQ